MHIHMHTHVATINEKETVYLKDSREGNMRGYDRRKGKGEMYNYIISQKITKI